MEDLKPNYYAIIPATVRYDAELPPNAKLLYGEITALANARGYCWASNKYFEELYSISDRTVQRIIKQLADKKYITVVLEQNRNRKIYISDPDEKFGVGVTKMSGSPEKNVALNNINNNIPGIKEYSDIDFDDLKDYNWLEDD